MKKIFKKEDISNLFNDFMRLYFFFATVLFSLAVVASTFGSPLVLAGLLCIYTLKTSTAYLTGAVWNFVDTTSIIATNLDDEISPSYKISNTIVCVAMLVLTVLSLIFPNVNVILFFAGLSFSVAMIMGFIGSNKDSHLLFDKLDCAAWLLAAIGAIFAAVTVLPGVTVMLNIVAAVLYILAGCIKLGQFIASRFTNHEEVGNFNIASGVFVALAMVSAVIALTGILQIVLIPIAALFTLLAVSIQIGKLIHNNGTLSKPVGQQQALTMGSEVLGTDTMGSKVLGTDTRQDFPGVPSTPTDGSPNSEESRSAVENQ